MQRRFFQFITTVLIAALLVAVEIGTLMQPTAYTFEKRPMAKMPGWPQQRADWLVWPRKFEAAWSDAAWQRQWAVSLFNRLRESLGISPSADVLIGKEGWLFFASDHVMDDYRNARLYDAEELTRWRRYLLYRNETAKAAGARYYLVIPPNKHTVYAEYLPGYVRQLSATSRLDQIIQFMADTDVVIIDLRPAMFAAKQIRQAYHKGDTHWNLWGANYAQYVILSRLSKDFPALQPVLYPSDRFVDADELAFSAANMHYYKALYYMMGVADQRSELEPLLSLDRQCVEPARLDLGPWGHLPAGVRKRVFAADQCAGGHYRALLFRDSFAELLQPFFSSTFSYTAYLRLARPMHLDYWDYFLSSIKPDIIIDEMVSRHLRHIPVAGRDYPLLPRETPAGLPDTMETFED